MMPKARDRCQANGELVISLLEMQVIIGPPKSNMVTISE